MRKLALLLPICISLGLPTLGSATLVSATLVSAKQNFNTLNDTSASVKPLSSEELKRFQKVAQSLGQVLSLSEELLPKQKLNIRRALFSSLAKFQTETGPSQPSDLKKAIDENDCAIKIDVPVNCFFWSETNLENLVRQS